MAKYNNPPIMEAVCEFKFAEDTKWDMTIPGILYSEIQREFPHKGQHLIQQVNILTKDTPAKTQIRKIELVKFLNKDKTTLIQIGPRMLSINQLKPYNTWSHFKHHIEYAFNILNQKTELTAPQRIGMRYINRVEVPLKEVDLNDYFEFRPYFGKNMQRNYNSFLVGCIFPFYEGRDSCKVELTGAVPENNEASAFMLDIDYSLAKPQSIAVDKSLEWIENAHEETSTAFEGCISNPLREIFGEVK
jgi:uncharacterized protein (TIGR04255 family)